MIRRLAAMWRLWLVTIIVILFLILAGRGLGIIIRDVSLPEKLTK
jgi:hypothetical protein